MGGAQRPIRFGLETRDSSHGRTAGAAATVSGLQVLSVGAGRKLQGLHNAADHDADQGPQAVPGLLHQSTRNEVRGACSPCGLGTRLGGMVVGW